jgi:DNA topoisomerase-1
MGKCTLIITEKPDAAERIAKALDATGRPTKAREKGVPYYLARRDEKLVVVPALGHLYTVSAKENARGCYPVFDPRWAPRYMVERNARHVRDWIEVISKLATDADTFIDACDYDIEGSIIGYCILKYACANKEQTSKRMKYSTLTKEDIEKAYVEPLPHLDFALIEAGLARHEIDWLYGVNLSRAMTTATKNWSGRYATLSTGRVQGPALKFIATREKAIRSFVPTPYWVITAEVQIGGQNLEAQYDKNPIETKRETNDILKDCSGKNGHVEKIETRQFQQIPPPPFDLSGLQSEAYRLFKYPPRRTANIAQRLYLDALISYPRTSSQKLPRSINYKAILESLSRIHEYEELSAKLLEKPKLRPREGTKEDPAHPAIHPTGELPTRVLDSSEERIWDLVIRRFMATFDDPAIRQSMKVHIDVNGHSFQIEGKQTLKEGWLHFYRPYVRLGESLLPHVEQGQKITVNRVTQDQKFTKPPPRHNPSSLLKKMEEKQIGTKGTRADIIQTLYDRKYVQDESITLTDLGFEVLDVLEEYCPVVILVKFTRELEQRMDRIQQGSEKKEKVLVETVDTLKAVTEELRKSERAIGERLGKALERSRTNERTIGPCPACKTGRLIALRSRKTGKRFIGCTNYFEGTCRTSFPLPQQGTIKPHGKNCSACGHPTVQVRMRGRRTWILCINPGCPSKDKGGKVNEVQGM